MILILKNKQILFLFHLLLLSCCTDSIHLSYKSQLITALKSGLHQTVVAYGTSLTAGGTWVSLLEDALNEKYCGKVTINNSGKNGANSRWGLENVRDKVISKKPDCVFIEFSINDAVPHSNISEEESDSNLCGIIDSILIDNPECEIILMTMSPGCTDGVNIESITRYYDEYKKVGNKYDLLVIDNFEVWMHLRAYEREKYEGYIPDGCHPNEIGNIEIIVKNILDVLQVFDDI